jgi:hypothetical protein
MFRRNISPPSSGSNSNPSKKQAIEAGELNCFCLHYKELMKILPPASAGFLLDLPFLLKVEGSAQATRHYTS